MNHKIALLADYYLEEYLRNIVGQLKVDIDLTIIPYKSLKELHDLYPTIEDKYDSFATMGNLSYKLLSHVGKTSEKLIYPISREPADYYRNFFLLLHKDRNIDFRKTFLDLSLYGDIPPQSVKDFYDDPETFINQRQKYVEGVSLGKILNFEDNILDNVLGMYQAGKLERVICQYGYVARSLAERDIPYSFVLPDPDNILDVLELLDNKFRLSQTRGNFPATIYVTTEQLQTNNLQTNSLDSINLHKYLIEFNYEFAGDFIIQPAHRGYEIFTSRQFVGLITQEFTSCLLNQYLFNKLGKEVLIGYGVGNDIMTSRNNAIEAGRLALEKKTSHLIFEDASIQVLDEITEEQIRSQQDEKLEEVARKSRLSINTILRIKSVINTLNTNELTTRELATSLQVTNANVNRFLNRLEEAGFAEIIGEKRSLSKGRPSQIYKINL